MTKRDWEEWVAHPVTQEFQRLLAERVEEIRAPLLEGSLVGATPGETGMKYVSAAQRALGVEEALEIARRGYES